MKYAFDISYQMGSVPERTYPYKDCAPQRCQRGLVSKVPSARRIRPPRAPGSRSIPASTNVTALIAVGGCVGWGLLVLRCGLCWAVLGTALCVHTPLTLLVP